MQSKPNPFIATRSKTLLVWVLVGTMTLLMALPVMAENPTATQVRSYDIAPGPLGRVLSDFADASGLLLSADAVLTDGKRSAGLEGRMTATQALQQLLTGTGLEYRFTGAETVTLARTVAQRETEPMELTPIMVEGQLIARTLQDTQTSAVVITGDELERRSDPNLFSIIERTPGVTKFKEGEFAIRGIRQRGPSASRGNSRLVQVNVDGATISNFELLVWRGPYSVWDLEQVEVLRGPQSTQSGRNALAGAINLRSKDPGYEPEFKARGEYGSDSTWGTSFAYNQPIIDDTLAARFSADVRKSDGFVTNTTLDDDEAGETDLRTYRLGMAWDPTDTFSAVLKYARHEDRAGQPLVEDGTYDTPLNTAKFIDTDSDTLTLRLDYEFSPNLTLQSETAYLTADVFQTEDGDSSVANASEFTRDRTADSLEQQFKVFYETERLSSVLGVYYLDYSEDSTTAGFFGGMTFNTNDKKDVENKAIFGEIEYTLAEHWRLIAGARFDDESFENDNSGTKLDGSYDAFLPKLGIVYDFTEDASLGFTYQKGYRAGGVVDSPNFGVVPFDPEFTDNYEVAFRSQLLNQRLTFNANVFYIDWSDQQVGQGTTFADFRIVNAGKSDQYGGEVEVQWQPTSRWDLFASAAYVKTEFIDFVDGANDFSGNEFPAAPAWTAALGATHYFSDHWYVSADASYTDKSFVEANNTLENDSRFLVNARLGYEERDWDVFIYARNLFDKYYLTDTFESGGLTLGRAGEPLTAGVIFSYRM